MLLAEVTYRVCGQVRTSPQLVTGEISVHRCLCMIFTSEDSNNALCHKCRPTGGSVSIEWIINFTNATLYAPQYMYSYAC